MRIHSCIFVLVLAVSTLYAQPASTLSNPSRSGILLLAYGGRVETWNEEVRHVADQVDLEIPTEVAFGIANRATLQSAVDRLVHRRVTEIVAVPLFVSSHSSVADCQAYMLGLRSAMPPDLKDFVAMEQGASSAQNGANSAEAADDMKPIHAPVPIRMTAALNAHPLVAEILADRAASVSKDPAQEVVILVAHGPVTDDENKLWLEDMGKLADRMRTRTNYAAIEYLTLRDDADAPVRDAATAELRRKVEEATKSNRAVLIVPLLLSYGGIEVELRHRLDGLSYRIPSQALLPDARIAGWVLSTARGNAAEVATKTMP